MPAPIATPFNALGAGNGFTNCLSKIDVSNYDYWTTLGGNQKGGSVTEQGKGLSEAMNLYWNYSKVIGNAESTLNGTTVSVTEATAGIYNFTPNSSTSNPVPPKDRVCSVSLSGREVVELSGGPSGNTNYIASFTNRGTFVRMYDGATNNDNNFVGYGLGGTPFIAFARVVNSATVLLKSYLNESILDSHDTAYVTVSGLHYVCEAIGENRDASLLTASNSGSGYLGGVDSTWSSAVTITSLESYTY